MLVERAKSVSIADKRNDPRFWVELENEREMLHRQLKKRREGRDLAAAIAKCSQSACGLAACPVCMARSDREIFVKMERLSQPPHRTLFAYKPWKLPLYSLVGDINLTRVAADMTEQLERWEPEIEAYHGRIFAANGGGRYGVGFIGAVCIKDALEIYEDFGVFAEPVTNLDCYQTPIYNLFAKNGVPHKSENCCVVSNKQYRELSNIEADLALVFGMTKCADLIIDRPINPSSYIGYH